VREITSIEGYIFNIIDLLITGSSSYFFVGYDYAATLS